MVLESEKATMEIPSDFAGTIKNVFVDAGDKITTGQKLISVETTVDKSDNVSKK